jgi:hypothetical protein
MFGLSFLSPWFLAGAAAIAVPIVLHMLRREMAPPLPFTVVRFLKQAPREQRQRRQIQDWLLLCLRMLALILLAIAFARPYIQTSQAAMRGTTVIAVDTSLSMSMPAQFERAKRAAVSVASDVRAGDRIAVIAFDDRATVVAMPSIDRGSARAAINGLTPGPGGTNYAAALAAAARVIGPSGGELVIVSDLQRSGWNADGTLPNDVTLRLLDVSSPVENVAVSALVREGDSLGQAGGAGRGGWAVALVANHGARPRTVRAALDIDGKAAGEQTASVEPGATATLRFAGATLPATGVAHVTVDDGAGLIADNERYLVLDPLPPPSVLVLAEQSDGDDAFYLREAILAVDPARAFKVDVVAAGARNGLDAARVKTYPAVWLLGSRGLDRHVRDVLASYVKEGGALFVSAGPLLDAATFATLFDDSVRLRVEEAKDAVFPTMLAPVDARHPIFAAFGPFAANLGQAQFTGALRIVAGDDARTVARFTNGLPALVEQKVGTGRVLVFASDVSTDWNDLPKQPTFVPFVNESLRYLANLRGQPRELLVGAVPEGAQMRTSAAAAPASAGLARTGVLKMERPDRLIAVNVDPRESWPVKVAEKEFLEHVRRTEPDGRSADVVAREQEGAQSWWRYGLMLMVGVLIVEGLWARRPEPSVT